MGISLNRVHRTAVFVRRTPNDASDYVERTQALVKSLNRKPDVSEGGTIKADVYTVLGANVVPGLVDATTTTDPVASPALAAQAEAAGFSLVAKPVQGNFVSGNISSPSLRAAAQDAGYTQVVIVTP